MTNTPETIYLIPGEDLDGAPAMVWCDDPAPSHACDPAEAVEYVRKDKHVPANQVILRTQTHSSGRIYETAEFFAYDQWWQTDIVSDRDEMMVRRMAKSIGVDLLDYRKGRDDE